MRITPFTQGRPQDAEEAAIITCKGAGLVPRVSYKKLDCSSGEPSGRRTHHCTGVVSRPWGSRGLLCCVGSPFFSGAVLWCPARPTIVFVVSLGGARNVKSSWECPGEGICCEQFDNTRLYMGAVSCPVHRCSPP